MKEVHESLKIIFTLMNLCCIALIKRTFRSQCIVFIQTKKEAHRMHLVLGLLGVKVGELHGNLSQSQVGVCILA